MRYRLGPYEPLPRWIEAPLGIVVLILCCLYWLFLPFYRAGQKIREWVWPELRWPG